MYKRGAIGEIFRLVKIEHFAPLYSVKRGETHEKNFKVGFSLAKFQKLFHF